MGSGDFVTISFLKRHYRGYPELLGALRYALERGWRVRDQSHGVVVYCPQADRAGCRKSIPHTPPKDASAAKRLLSYIDGCSHVAES